MTNMSKEEKRMMLFDMQEHPEKYTDEQVERLLDDEEVKEFFHELAMARMAGKKANPKEVDVDGAWKEFVQAHHEGKLAIDAGKSKGAYRNRMKIAASIVGIIFLSGVALAAIHNGWLGFPASDQTADNKGATEQLATTQALPNDSLRAATAEKKDSLDMNPWCLMMPNWEPSWLSYPVSIMSRWSMWMPVPSTSVSSSTGTRRRLWSRTWRF